MLEERVPMLPDTISALNLKGHNFILALNEYIGGQLCPQVKSCPILAACRTPIRLIRTTVLGM